MDAATSSQLLFAVPPPVVALLQSLGAFSLPHYPASCRSLGEHLLSTAALLRCAGADDSLCAAGALHSVYGTSSFARAVVSSRDEGRARVAGAAGQRAERLAFLFCALDRPRCLLAVASLAEEGAELALRRPGGASVHVSREEVEALLLIEAANLLEQDDELLLRVAAAPEGAPLRAAVERVRGCWRGRPLPGAAARVAVGAGPRGAVAPVPASFFFCCR